MDPFKLGILQCHFLEQTGHEPKSKNHPVTQNLRCGESQKPGPTWGKSIYYWSSQGELNSVNRLLLTAILEALITLVILTSLMNIEGPAGRSVQQEYQVLDFYAGAARVARASRELGDVAAAFDISYHSDPKVFDINSPSGMVSLCSILLCFDMGLHNV